MKKLEKNIATFDKDVLEKGRYVYTDQHSVSSKLATFRQSLEIVRLLKTYIKPRMRILDIGCGDGTYSMELFYATSPKFLLGFDPAKEAVKVARAKVPVAFKDRIIFKSFNIYDIASHIEKDSFDVAVVRGVLHHLDDPEKAIKAISSVLDQIIVLEPNGYNPILKIIEKVSPYHQDHDEKSYWPPKLLGWFKQYHFRLVEQKFVCITPYFCPPFLARLLHFVEPFFESLPFIRRFYTGTNVFIIRKT